MPYIKTEWKDRVVERPLTFTMQNNPDETITLVPSEGQIIESGTPITAEVMNNLEKQYEEIAVTAQMTKITDDEGGVKINVSAVEGDVLADIVAAGKGIHTFYAVTGSRNLPPAGVSIRGFAHMTDPNYGWAIAMDYRNNFYTNYYDAPSGGWKGWNAPPPWNNMSLQNGWVAYGGADPTPQYTKVGSEVRIKGTIKNGTFTAGTALFTLPSKYRPAQRHIHVAQGINNQFVRVLIEPTGTVSLFTSMNSNGWLSLDGITFIADGN